MTNGMVGADIAELETLAGHFHRAAQQLTQLTPRISAAVSASPWRGSDCDGFASTWQSDCRARLAAAAGALEAASHDLHLQARQQADASAAAGGSSAGDVWSRGASAGGDLGDIDFDPLHIADLLEGGAAAAVLGLSRFAPRNALGRFIKTAGLSRWEVIRLARNPANWVAKAGNGQWSRSINVARGAAGAGGAVLGFASGAFTQWSHDSATGGMGTGEKLARAGTTGVATAGGAWAGAAAGAQLGATVGVIGGPAGVAVGALIGGAAGGIVGSAAGEWAGEHLLAPAVSDVIHAGDAIANALHWPW